MAAVHYTISVFFARLAFAVQEALMGLINLTSVHACGAMQPSPHLQPIAGQHGAAAQAPQAAADDDHIRLMRPVRAGSARRSRRRCFRRCLLQGAAGGRSCAEVCPAVAVVW